MVDTGAPITLVAQDKLKRNVQPKKPIVLISGVVGSDHKIATKGQIVGTFHTNGKSNWVNEIHVVGRESAGPYDGFLGLDFLKKHRAIIDIANGLLILRAPDDPHPSPIVETLSEQTKQSRNAQGAEGDKKLNVSTSNKKNFIHSMSMHTI